MQIDGRYCCTEISRGVGSSKSEHGVGPFIPLTPNRCPSITKAGAQCHSLTPFLSHCCCLQLPHFRRTTQRHDFLFLSAFKDTSHRLPFISNVIIVATLFSLLERLIPKPAFAQYNFRLSLPSSATDSPGGGVPPSSPFFPDQKRCLFASGRNGTSFCIDGRNGPPKPKSHPVHGEPPAPFGLSVTRLSTGTSNLDLLFLRRENIDQAPLDPTRQSECGM